MIDNHPPTPECTCEVCTAPRFDKEAEFRQHIQPLMEALQKECDSRGFAMIASACYGSKLIEGQPALGVFMLGSGMKDGWAPLSFKIARDAMQKNGTPGSFMSGTGLPIGVSVISGGTLMDVLDAIAQKFQDNKPDSP